MEKLKSEWTEYELGELLSYEQPTPYLVSSTDYSDKFDTPVLTAGKTFVLGYTDEKDGIYDALPVIIFDDFTTASRYVNFKFKVKSSAMKILTPNTELVLPKFIYYRMQVIQFDHSTHKRYWIQQYSKIKVKIPPLAEQERIVARIEELFSELDKGVETLQKIKQQLAVYRQAVLKKAFENLNGTVYSVEDVCEEVKVGIVIKPSQYYTTMEHGVKAFRSANVREFRVDDFNWVYLSKEGQEKNERTIVHAGDVLVVRSGYPGTACVVPPEFEGCNAIDVLIAVPDKEKILPEYLCAYTNSPFGKMFVSEKKRGVGQKHFNVGGYSKMKIGVPDFTKQKEIVSQIDSELSICNQIYKTIEMSLQQSKAMRQSILRLAFEGRL
ncbi:MAG: restriction endonuclease subunit S [Anaerotignum sp.]|nr:restriction endonuclease subunit S [Anaerotignum sp.]